MINNLLARVGIGAATVNTQVDRVELRPGDTLRGEVVLQGGGVTQDIDGISLALMTDVRRGDYYNRAVLTEHRLTEQLTLQPGEIQTSAFAFPVPLATPLSLGHQRIILRTSLNISGAIDPKDGDPLVILPHPLMEPVLDGLKRLGFHLHHAESGYNHRMGWEMPIVQTLEYKPAGRYRQTVQELEVIFRLYDSGLDVWLEIDRRMGALTGLLDDLDLNERHTRFSVTQADVDRRDWTEFLAETIERYSQN